MRVCSHVQALATDFGRDDATASETRTTLRSSATENFHDQDQDAGLAANTTD